MHIFVSLASYRDPEIIKTVKDFIENESGNNTITYGICLQDTIEYFNEVIRTFDDHKRKINIDFLPYKDAKGVCFARRRLQNMVTYEDFFLQMDSHMRSIPNWDEALIDSYNKTNIKKAIITAYPPHYALDDVEKKYLDIKFSNVTKFNKPVRTKKSLHGCNGDYLNTIGVPIRNIHLAGGFVFAPSSWINDAPYSDEFYFEGEEDLMTVQSFTTGWTAFSPEKAIVYHTYTNNLLESDEKYRPLHWEDNHLRKQLNHKEFDLDEVELGDKKSLELYFQTLNQFSDNWNNFELEYEPNKSVHFILLAPDGKEIHRHFYETVDKNIIHLNCEQSTLHSAYGYKVIEYENDDVSQRTIQSDIKSFSFI